MGWWYIIANILLITGYALGLLPRDCAEYVEREMGDACASCSINPSGDGEAFVTTRCLKSADMPGWSLILRNVEGNKLLTRPREKYLSRVGKVGLLAQPFFLGLQHITDMNWDPTDIERPLAYKFLLKDANTGVILHATYDDVVVRYENYTLDRIGSYFGNAGDNLRSSLGRPFCPPKSQGNMTNVDVLPCWFGHPNYQAENMTHLTGEVIQWGNQEFQKVEVYVRPKDFHDARTCPPVDDPWGEVIQAPRTTELGAILEFRCRDPDVYVGDGLGGTLLNNGTIKCLRAEPLGKRLRWEYDVTIPCENPCPNGWVLSTDHNSCYYFSDDVASLGSPEAASLCAAMNSSIGYIVNETDLEHGEEDVFYHTGYTMLTDGSIFPEYVDGVGWFNLTCKEQCKEYSVPLCVMVKQGGLYTLEACHSPGNYICMIPEKCPPSYTAHMGHCYWVEGNDEKRDSIAHLANCNANGSALVFPETKSTLRFLRQQLNETSEWIPFPEISSFAVGVSTLWSNYTQGFFYDPELYVADLFEMTANYEDKPFRAMIVNMTSFAWEIEPITMEHKIQYAICQYRGPVGCWAEAPSSASNTFKTGSSENEIGYNPGYLGDVVIGNQTSENLWCLGQLGDLWELEVDVFTEEACPEDPPEMSKGMEMIVTDSYRYENDTIEYRCTEGMGTKSGSLRQKVTCKKISPDSYNYIPDNVIPCNRCLNETDFDGVVKSWNPGIWLVGDSFSSSCFLGHLLPNGEEEQTISCTFAGWRGTNCYKACLAEPMVKNANVSGWSENSAWFVNDSVTATCHPGFQVAGTGTLFRSVQCSDSGLWEIYPSCVPDWIDFSSIGSQLTCDEEPFVDNAITTWFERTWYIGEKILATCNQSYLFVEEMLDSKDIACTEKGWNITAHCEMVCKGEPNVTKAYSQWFPGVWPSGSNITVTCFYGYEVLNKSSLVLSCTDEGVWDVMPPCERNPEIELFCTDEPVVINGLSNWSTKDRWKEFETLDVDCSPGYYLADRSSRHAIQCTEYGWHAEVHCYKACTEEPMLTNAASGWSPGIWMSGDRLQVFCNPGLGLKTGVASQIIGCRGEAGWQKELPCGCLGQPPIANGKAEGSPHHLWAIGESVTLTCLTDFVFGDKSVQMDVQCTDEGWPPEVTCFKTCPEDLVFDNAVSNWSPGIWFVDDFVLVMCNSPLEVSKGVTSQVVKCLEEGWSETLPCVSAKVVTSNPDTAVAPSSDDGQQDPSNSDPNAPPPPPTTEAPQRFPDANVLEEAYDITTTNHMPSLEQFMVNAVGGAPEFKLTNGPFGFGYGVDLDSASEQCMKKQNYATRSDCTPDPRTCQNGFSISIWERVNISMEVFHTVHKFHQDDKRYIISTGGDEFGHPGISLYHQGLALIGLVSTGDKYWKLQVLGAFMNNEWYNVGLRWKPSEGENGGLEMYVNAIKVGQEHHSKGSLVTPAKAVLDPTEILIACHRDSDNRQYRDFNDADFDEFAFWDHYLPDDDTIFFLGGFEGETENLSPEEFAIMMKKTDLSNPAQAQIAMAMFSAMADNLPGPGGDKGNDTLEDNDVPYNDSMKRPLDSASLQLKGMADVLSGLTKPSLLKKEMTLEDMKIYSGIYDAASKILNESHAERWEQIADHGHRGALGVKEDLERYTEKMAQNLAMDKKKLEPKAFVTTTENIMVKVDKMTISDFEGLGSDYRSPNYKQNAMMGELWTDWGFPSDKCLVPTGIFSSPLCKSHPISVVTLYYDSFDDVGPSDMNEAEMNPGVKKELDSRVIYINLVVDPPTIPRSSPDYYTCEPDPRKVAKNPTICSLENKNPIPSHRGLQFHDNENTSPIFVRRCVQWNPHIMAYDSKGCAPVAYTEQYSKCSCVQMGSYAIVSEYVEERILPDEPDWSLVIKFIGYIISALCIIIYILFVLLAGDLKDHFHASGAFFAASILGGSIAMLMSDSENVRGGRHACTAVGAMIQGFYVLAGAWLTMVCHAGFKGVTKAIIGGRLQSYILISFGITLISVGGSVVFFIHDLGTDPRCFVSWYDDVKFIFVFMPMMAFICLSLFYVCVIFFNITHATKSSKIIMTNFSSFILGSTFVTIYFSFVWCLGFFAYIKIDGEDTGVYPFFQVLNSFMGVVILLGIGFYSSKFRGVLTKTAKQKREQLQKYKDNAKPVKGKKLKKDAKKPKAQKPPSQPSPHPPSPQPPSLSPQAPSPLPLSPRPLSSQLSPLPSTPDLT